MNGGKPSPTILVVTAFRPQELVTPLAHADCRAEVITIDASAGPLGRSVEAARRTWRALRRLDPDLVLLDCHETIGAPVTSVARRHDVPVVVRLVGNTWRKLEEERIEPARANRDLRRYARHRTSYLLDEYIFHRATGFITVSTDLADVVERRTGCPRNRIQVVPVPVTTDMGERGSAVTARERFGIEETQVILTVTNLLFRAKLRGVQAIVSDVLDLLREREDLAYLVAGGGQYHGELVAWLDATVEDQSVRRRIYTPGYVDEVADLYALGDVFAYVSYLDGYPNVVLEAQTARLPVVANDAHGMRDQITDGETGLLVDPSIPGAIRDRITFLLDNPAERRRIGDRARTRAMRENAPDVIGRRISVAIDELLEAFGLDSAVQPSP